MEESIVCLSGAPRSGRHTLSRQLARRLPEDVVLQMAQPEQGQFFNPLSQVHLLVFDAGDDASLRAAIEQAVIYVDTGAQTAFVGTHADKLSGEFWEQGASTAAHAGMEYFETGLDGYGVDAVAGFIQGALTTRKGLQISEKRVQFLLQARVLSSGFHQAFLQFPVPIGSAEVVLNLECNSFLEQLVPLQSIVVLYEFQQDYEAWLLRYKTQLDRLQPKQIYSAMYVPSVSLEEQLPVLGALAKEILTRETPAAVGFKRDLWTGEVQKGIWERAVAHREEHTGNQKLDDVVYCECCREEEEDREECCRCVSFHDLGGRFTDCLMDICMALLCKE